MVKAKGLFVKNENHACRTSFPSTAFLSLSFGYPLPEKCPLLHDRKERDFQPPKKDGRKQYFSRQSRPDQLNGRLCFIAFMAFLRKIGVIPFRIDNN